ncbi:MAG: hypothetical protein JJU06_15025 [Ectothiorhodospiraceae bacterium]|nr:hypothetical protein [Ectothiorhodospiraceae bacterium]
MNAWLLDSADGAQAPFRVVVAGFGKQANAVLEASLAGRLPPPAGMRADLYCALAGDDDPVGAAAARWLEDLASPGALTLLVAPAGGAADLRLNLPATGETVAGLLGLFDALQRLTGETGVVCVEPDDLRFALRGGGECRLAAVEAPDAADATRALLRAFEAQGLAAGCGGRAVVAVLADESMSASELEGINLAVQGWLGPEAVPVLGLRHADRRVRIRALLTGYAQA